MGSPEGYSFLSLFEGVERQPEPGGPSHSFLHSKLLATDAATPNSQASAQGQSQPLDLKQPTQDWRESDIDLDMAEPAVSICKVLRSIWYHGTTVFFIFLVSLLIFPGFLTVTCAKGPFEGMGNDWYRLILVTVFNVSDLLGRVVAGPTIKWIPNSSLWIIAASRIVLVPVFWWFVYDDLDWWWGPMVFTFLLGVSNGCIGSICMMHGPSRVEAHEREMAGTLMAFLLMMGIIGGATLQLVVARIFKSDNVGVC